MHVDLAVHDFSLGLVFTRERERNSREASFLAAYVSSGYPVIVFSFHNGLGK